MAKWLQLMRKKSSFRTCSSCGFDQIRKEDNYCMMCGVDVRGDGDNERRQTGICKKSKARADS